MKKRYLIGVSLALVLAISALTGCKDSKDLSSDPAAEQTDEAGQEESTATKTPAAEAEEPEGTADTGNASPLPALVIKTAQNNTRSDDGKVLLFSGTYSVPELTGESAAKFPALDKALKNAAGSGIDDFNSGSAEYTGDAKIHYGEDPDFFQYGSYYYNNTVLLRRLDSRVLSYADYSESFMGGAHGMYGEAGVTYDVNTGEKLSLTDVLTTTDGLQQKIRDALLSVYPEDYFFEDLDSGLSHLDPTIDEYVSNPDDPDDYRYPFNWCLTPFGIRFYFPPYELAPYATGSLEAVLTYEDNPDLFTEEYLPDPEAGYVYDFPNEVSVLDITGDGKADDLSCWKEYSGDDYTNAVGVSVSLDSNDASIKDVNIGRGMIYSHLVCPGDGKKYLYAEAEVNGDHYEYLVFDLSHGKSEAVGRYKTGTVFDGSSDGVFLRELITDPAKLALDKLEEVK